MAGGAVTSREGGRWGGAGKRGRLRKTGVEVPRGPLDAPARRRGDRGPGEISMDAVMAVTAALFITDIRLT